MSHTAQAFFTSLDEVLAPAHTALLVIDMQNDLLHPDGAYARIGEDISLTQGVLPAITALISAARPAGVLVAYTQNTTLPDGRSDSPAWNYFKRYSRPGLAGQYTVDGTWGHELVAELAPRSDEPVVRKHRSDAFIGTDLDLILRSNGVQTVVAAGVVTNGCVESSIRHAAFLDYYTAVAADACASTSKRMHDLAIELLQARHDVCNFEDIIRIWEGVPA